MVDSILLCNHIYLDFNNVLVTCVSPSFSLGWKKKQKDHRLGSNLAKNDSIPLKQIKLALRFASRFGQDLFWPLHSIIFFAIGSKAGCWVDRILRKDVARTLMGTR